MSPERDASGRRAAAPWAYDLRAPNSALRGGHGRRTDGATQKPLSGALRAVTALVRQVFAPPDRRLAGKGAGRANPRGWVGAAAGAWVVVVLYTYVVAPRGALALAFGFALLYGALATTLVPLCRVVGGWLMPRALRTQIPFVHAVRQGLLLALVVTANLALLAGRAWSIAALVVGLIAFGIEEAVTLARK